MREGEGKEVMAKWIRCQTCQGDPEGKITEIKNGVAKRVRCPALCNKGKINVGLL